MARHLKACAHFLKRQSCPQKLRGDLTKWLFELDTGVYVGNLSARVRDGLWDRICRNISSGRAVMAYSANNEQKLDFRIYGGEGYSISSICKYLGIKANIQHRALEECKLTYRIFEKLKKMEG